MSDLVKDAPVEFQDISRPTLPGFEKYAIDWSNLPFSDPDIDEAEGRIEIPEGQVSYLETLEG